MQGSGNRTAVVFYSLEGNTRFAAGKIAKMLDADLIEIQPVKPYPTGKISKFFWGGKSSTLMETPKLKTCSFREEDYDTVILGTPLWAWKIAPPLRTFLQENNLSGKNTAAFISCGGGDTAKAFDEIRKLTGKEKLAAELVLVNPHSMGDGIDKKLSAFCGQTKKRFRQ